MSVVDLWLHRKTLTAFSSIGELWTDDSASPARLLVVTLEPTMREPKDGRPTDPDELAAWVENWKIPNKTAILTGRFELKLQMSAKRGYIVPWYQHVPGFEAVEMHIGNYPIDTDACTLVGRTIGPEPDFIGSSSDAFWNGIMPFLKTHFDAGDQVFVNVLNP